MNDYPNTQTHGGHAAGKNIPCSAVGLLWFPAASVVSRHAVKWRIHNELGKLGREQMVNSNESIWQD